MQLGDRYRWPDGIIITLDSVTRTGMFNTRFEWDREDDGVLSVAVGSISPADLSVLIRNNIVTLVEDEPDGQTNEP